ncbi:MAG: glycosyl hydrolase family 18 protein [Patescibacteria group bacterium]
MNITPTTLLSSALIAAFAFSGLAPLEAHAASSRSSSKIEISGWIPYWRTEAGTRDAKKHLSQMTEINPFAYSVRADGSLADTAKIYGKDWQSLITDAEKKRVKVIPTVMWSDTNAIHTVLSNPATRAAHVKAIADLVENEDFDGIDIDYEGKKADTRIYFSAFLSELNDALGKKQLDCTIEARMPLSARFSGTPPANIEYANDLKEVNRHCDRVRIMTYDQQTADLELNKVARNAKEIYAPVADVKWVEKVVNYMGQDIDKKKMVIGIATYGYIYQIMPHTDGSGYGYIKVEAFNPAYGTQIAKEYKITPERNRAGELSLSYVPKDQIATLPNQAALARLAPKGTSSANLAAAGALALAKSKQQQAPVQYLTWSDSNAIKQKVDLAKKLKLAGVAVFKIDGGSDPKMWDVLK